MSKVSKVEIFIKFVEKMYFPLLVKYGILPDDKEYPEESEKIKTIYRQKVVNRLDKSTDRESYFENYRTMIDLVTDGGIVYKDENGTQFEDINEAFITSTLGTMAGLCKKNGVPMEDYSLGNASILPTEAEEKVASFDREDYIMFLTGNKEAFFNKHGNVQKKDLLEQKKELLEASKVEEPVLVEIPSVKKTF